MLPMQRGGCGRGDNFQRFIALSRGFSRGFYFTTNSAKSVKSSKAHRLVSRILFNLKNWEICEITPSISPCLANFIQAQQLWNLNLEMCSMKSSHVWSQCKEVVGVASDNFQRFIAFCQSLLQCLCVPISYLKYLIEIFSMMLIWECHVLRHQSIAGIVAELNSICTMYNCIVYIPVYNVYIPKQKQL